ncbi:MAG: hypothetical protein WA477_00420 [Candidatus Sulfotelmatobacter sp.]
MRPLIQLSDVDIDALIHEPKNTPASLSPLRLNERLGHRRKECPVSSASGNEFFINVRQTVRNPLNFSVILSYRIPGYTTLFRLRRYNGKHGGHTNEIEGNHLGDECHIHTATERYQKLGGDEESFAVETTRYSDLNGAIRCLLEDCGFTPPPPDPQFNLTFPAPTP